MRLSGNIRVLDLVSLLSLACHRDLARGIFCSTISSQGMTSARVALTALKTAVFGGAAKNFLRNAQRKNCRHKLYKRHNRRILTATMYGHFAVYESLNSCIRAHFCCGLLEVGSLMSAFRFSPCRLF